MMIIKGAVAIMAVVVTGVAPASATAAPGTAGRGMDLQCAGLNRPLLLTSCPTPRGRVWDSWAADPDVKGQVVLFGGDTGNGTNNDGTSLGGTWIWNGSGWAKRPLAVAPSPRTGAAMAYDSATHQLLLFGGSTLPGTAGGFLGDTWIWTGRAWRSLHPATSPSARHNADMVYDAARKELILFGGYNGAYLGDTWAWNGSDWTQLHPAASPSPRDTDSLAYDPATMTAILFGGFNGIRLGDTWSWDGTTWTRLHPPVSPDHISPAWQCAYDPASKQLVLFGGDQGPSFRSNATWTWDGTTWTQLAPATSPRKRAYGALTYDPALHALVLFGGAIIHADPSTIWEWNGNTWQRPSAS